MKRLALVSLVVAAVTGAQESVLLPPLTFGEMVVLAGRNTPPATTAASSVGGLRDRLPNVRVEVTGNASRTLDMFSQGPLQVQYASSVLASTLR